MSFTKTKIALAVGVATALVSGVAVSAAYAVESNGSSVAMYQFDGDTGELVTPGTVVAWTKGAVGGPNKTNIDDRFIGSADATDVRGFIAPRGQESNISAWTASTQGGFAPGTKEILQPNISPSSMIAGQFQKVKDEGGQYSIGFAYVKNNALTIADAGVVFHHITVAPGGNYTFEDPTGTAPVDAPVGSADINLSATTIAASDGTLSLVVPANTTAAIGNPTLVDNLSTSTGALGDFTVKDSRVLTHKGWTLTSTVADFVAGSSTIPAARLSVTPKIVTTTAAGVTVAAAGAAATTGKPFAEAGADATVGDTVLNADLKFVAPATAAAGTYTSKMTLTLTSK
jgi:hypothetical protein